METDDSPGPAQRRDGIYLTVLNRPKIVKRCGLLQAVCLVK
ncbi:hypothetical protein LEP1GSC016_1613 [Leptospira borgpetersenii serovar Hardjo-bovis str. Sponselee]|uniref:Uncharacterized protein n=1 Tax=Leptospira borgpetersenii serovar Hardjo-bovis str. Sponselee TaxID=1303729 RepID=M6BFB9_LEPBO|nr:hypothetical protein LEP1GSC016_1613 [Leptospira borgpetersenii serovar Hardjo-bovis str. Sponselee]